MIRKAGGTSTDSKPSVLHSGGSTFTSFLEVAITKLHEGAAGNTVSKFLNDIITVVSQR